MELAVILKIVIPTWEKSLKGFYIPITPMCLGCVIINLYSKRKVPLSFLRTQICFRGHTVLYALTSKFYLFILVWRNYILGPNTHSFPDSKRSFVILFNSYARPLTVLLRFRVVRSSTCSGSVAAIPQPTFLLSVRTA